VDQGERAGYDTITHKVVCPACLERRGLAAGTTDRPVESGMAGGSLRRTHDQRAASRDARVRERFPLMGGFLLAVTAEPASTAAFQKGAEGEEKAARRIIHASGDDVLFLLNRRLSNGRRDGDIDMIAISAAGIHVIDVKHYKNAKIEVRRSGGLFSARTEKLYVAGRDKTVWLAGLDKQRTAVADALDIGQLDRPIPISVALCFVDGDLPLFGRLKIGNVSIYGSRELGRRLKTAIGPIDADQRRTVHSVLESRLPPA
jgi:Holliday junction resolvase-like predicted endonuclease